MTTFPPPTELFLYVTEVPEDAGLSQCKCLIRENLCRGWRLLAKFGPRGIMVIAERKIEEQADFLEAISREDSHVFLFAYWDEVPRCADNLNERIAADVIYHLDRMGLVEKRCSLV